MTRLTQSMVFLVSAGTDALYSGETSTTASCSWNEPCKLQCIFRLAALGFQIGVVDRQGKIAQADAGDVAFAPRQRLDDGAGQSGIV